MVQERRFVSDLSLLAAAHCGYGDHRSIALQQMNVETLRLVPLFESLDTQAAHELCELLESLDSKAGAVLFRAGDEGNAMYIIEQAAQLTLSDRAADLIAEFGGSWKFIIAAVFLFNVWVWINIWLARMGKIGFDPYPFLLLSTGINMLSVLQAPIILMSQNRQS